VNFLLAAITSLLIAIFAAAFAAPYVVDWNQYRDVFEAQASKLAGRPVRVEGDVGFTILPVPEVRFEEVAIADPSGDFSTPSATARAFRMTLSIPPLLRGKFEARKIELDRLALRLGLDADGHVIWPRMGDAAAGLPFLPADVSLRSVSLNDASLAFARPGQPPRWRVDSVNGELSAETLRGPFKFAGQVAAGDAARDVQLSIGRMGEDGTMPAKLVSRGGEAIYRAQGSLSEVNGGVTFTGDVGAAAPETAPDAQPRWEVTATAEATLDGATLSDLKVAMTRQQRPQTLIGSAEYSWSRGLRLNADLSSRWLDIDLLAGDDVAGRKPAQVMLRLPNLLSGVPVPAESARIRLAVDQINLGGDTIRDLDLVARRNEGRWGVERLEAGLPGGSDFGFEGRFSRNNGGPVLSGTVRASGTQLGRLLAWAFPGEVAVDAGGARTFSLSGEVESAPGRFSIANISARLGESRVTGALRFTPGEPSRVDLNLNARLLDLRPYIVEASAKSLVGLLGAGWTEALLPDTSKLRWDVDLRANRLVLPELAASDTVVRLRVREENVKVDRLTFRGRGGLSVEASGRYPRDGAIERAAITLALSANSAQAAADAARLLPGGAAWASAHLPRLRAAMPVTLTADLRPSGLDRSAWLEVDGLAGGTVLKADARLFADGRYHVFASAENPRLGPLIRQLAPGLDDWLAADRVAGPARLSADVAGAGDAPLAGRARIEAGDIRLAFDGSADPRDAALRLDGRISLRAPEARPALMLAGLASGTGGVNGPLSVDAALTVSEDVYEASAMRVRLSGEEASGALRLDLSGAAPAIDADLAASRFALPAAAALLVETPPRSEAGPDDVFWPDTPFALQALERVTGRLAVEADQLVLAGSLIAREAAISVRLADGALRVTDLSGRLYGGGLRAAASLRPERGRMLFRGNVNLDNVDLAQLPHGDGAPLASGRAALNLTAESEGLTPRGLITVIDGRGRLSLGEGEIRGLDPQVLAATARSYLEAAEQPEKPAPEMLAGPLLQSRLAHNGAEIALSIEDGALRAERTGLDGLRRGARVSANGRLDLTAMRLSSQWRLTSALDDGEPLPPVRMTFDGPLVDFGGITPDIGAAEFEQFLTVKRLERNVERLEELERRRVPPDRPDEVQSQPSAGLSAAASASHEDSAPITRGADEPPPLGSFSTEIEESPQAQPSEDGPQEGPDDAVPRAPAAASTTPGASLDDPQVVEDARRELMREAPRQRKREPGDLFEIFRN